MRKNGKSNYGLDFGVNRWGTHEGVSTHMEQVDRDFAEMESLGFNTLRWFVFTDGRGGIEFDKDGSPVALADRTQDDFDAVLTIARAHNIRLIFVLLDFLWMYDIPQTESPDKVTHAHVLKTEAGQRSLVENIFVPLFQRFANHDAVLAWEVMNEPDWVVRGLDVNRKRVRDAITLDVFRSFVSRVADAVHTKTAHYVTVGGGRVRNLHVWDDNELRLDFLQAHTYNDFTNHKWDGTIYGKHFGELNLSRPLLIGEFTTNARAAFDYSDSFRDISLVDYLSFCKSQGYAGSLFWSFNGIDKCATEDRAVLKEWAEREKLV